MVLSSTSLLKSRDLIRPNKEFGLNYNVSSQVNTLETVSKADGAIFSSHLILKHPLEEPQVYLCCIHLKGLRYIYVLLPPFHTIRSFGLSISHLDSVTSIGIQTHI